MDSDVMIVATDSGALIGLKNKELADKSVKCSKSLGKKEQKNQVCANLHFWV